MKKNKKTILYSVLLVLVLVVVAMGVSFAYFANQINNETEVDVVITTSNGSKVVYTPGEDIIFDSSEPGETKTSIFSMALTSPKDSSDTIKYGFNWQITENNFVYEPNNSGDPQLVYYLYYSTDNSNWIPYVENIDCTEWTGEHEILNNYSMSADANETNTIYWKFVLEYKSYDYNQSTNMSKKLNGEIILDKEDI